MTDVRIDDLEEVEAKGRAPATVPPRAQARVARLEAMARGNLGAATG